MCGLLAISANHLAALLDDETTKQAHMERAAWFLQEFSTGWGEVKGDSVVAEVEEAKTGAQMVCIQRCSHWTFETSRLSQGMIPEVAPFKLQSFTTTVQCCVDPNFALRSAVGSDHMPEEAFPRARDNLGGSSDAGVSGNAPPVLLECFRTLPYRMAEALERPDSISEFFATLSAIDALVQRCSLNYASDDVGAAWMGMESWLKRSSEPFNRMVWHRNSAALIVLAHWSLLVERAEHHCWFLRGSATKVLRQVAEDLPEDGTAKSLVENLMDWK